jgi:hypothetical protein
MRPPDRTRFWIRLPYWLGIVADALWAVALLFPPVFARLTGTEEFDPDLHVRQIMAIGGALMLGWTLLLAWAVRRPVERRAVILLTAFPVVAGMFVIALVGVLDGNTTALWLVAKTAVLIATMVASYVLAGRVQAGSDERSTS